MPYETLQDESANWRRTSLLSFYLATLLSTISLSLVGSDQSFRKPLLSLAGTGAAVWFLLRFLHSNDEREQVINYRALTFASVGTLAFSTAIGFLQSLGFLILYSWRYQ